MSHDLDTARLVFGGAAALILYSYVGYPLLLWLLARLRPAPAIRKQPFTPSVTLLMVVYDEEGCIEAKLRNCLALDYPEDRLDILVASDGSTDGTEEIVARFAPDGVRLLSLPGPRGKAAALNQAVAESRAELLVLCDARQLLAPNAVRELSALFADPTVGAVSGELHISSSGGSTAGEGVGLYWRYEKLIRRTESRLDSTVGATGALYALRRSLYRTLDSQTILDDVALPMSVVRAGFRVVFEPATEAFDQAAGSASREYRRKVRTLAGNYQLVALYPWLLDPRQNRMLWQFVSHKLLRLLVPWCLLLLLAASAVLAARGENAYALFLLAQLVFYLLAGAGWVLERFDMRLRWLSTPYAFILLNVAAGASLFGFLFGKEKASWKAAS